MLCCRVVLSCPSGGQVGGGQARKFWGGFLVGGRWSSSGIRVSACSPAVGWWGQCGASRRVARVDGLSAPLRTRTGALGGGRRVTESEPLLEVKTGNGPTLQA